MNYTELQVTTNFSFLQGASHPDEMVNQAASLGFDTIGIADRNTLAGVVRAHAAGRNCGVRILPGCRLDLLDGAGLLAYPMNLNGYSKLTNLLTLGNRRAEKGKCFLYKNDVYACAGDIKFIVVPPSNIKLLDLNLMMASKLM
jgi:error-prone DNA polymerase